MTLGDTVMGTIGDWLHRLVSDWDGAWREVDRDLRAVIVPDHDAAAVQEARLLVLEDLCQDLGPVRRAARDAPLEKFLRGCLRNRLRRIHSRGAVYRRHLRAVSPEKSQTRLRLEQVPDRTRPYERILTSPQLEAVRLLRSGLTVSRIALTLGIARSSVYDRLRRALARINRAKASEATAGWRDSLDWRVLLRLLRTRDRDNLDLFMLHLMGATHKQVAERRALTPDAVKKRLQRLRRTERDRSWHPSG